MSRFSSAFGLIAMIFLPTLSNGVESFDQVLSAYKIVRPAEQVMNEIARRFEVVRKLNDGYEVVVPAIRKSELLQLDPNAQLLEADISLPPLPTNPFKSTNGPDYRTLADVQSEMARFAADHPKIAQLVAYGRSQQGRELVALKLSDNVTVDENEPEIMLTAATHGDEVITTEILMNLLGRLIENYGKDSRLTALVDGREIYFIPVVNPDGFYTRSRYDNNVDPNRSYPHPGDPNAKSTASIRGLLDFFHTRDFVGSIDFHAYGEMVMFPWAYTYNAIAPEYFTPYNSLAGQMAELNGYAFGPISKVIYVAVGSSADYYFWKNKTKAFAVEVGMAKQPIPSKIPAYTEAQAEPTWRFLESF